MSPRATPRPVPPLAELPGAGTPEGEQLRDAAAAFEAGDYARVHALGDSLARAADPKVADAARDLVRRTSVDPVQMVFLTACLGALLVIFSIYVVP